MKDYEISYCTSMGDCSLMCYSWEVVSILRTLVHMALQGFQFSNVTIKRL